jgi:hypothetical protein
VGAHPLLNTIEGENTMNIEELKLVLATVATVTDDAKTVAIWYIVASYGLPFLINCVVCVVVYGIARLAVNAVTATNEWSQHGKNITRAWGGEGSTYSYGYDLVWINKAIKAGTEARK